MRQTGRHQPGTLSGIRMESLSAINGIRSTQNSAVRKLLDDADAQWFNNEVVDKAAHDAARERAQIQSSRVTSDNSILLKRLAELEAENQRMRQEIKAFKKQQALVLDGVPGFKL